MIRRAGAAVGLVLVAVASPAQDMEPNAYAASPVGANFFVVSATRSTGDILFDPTLPLTDCRGVSGAVAVAQMNLRHLGGCSSVAEHLRERCRHTNVKRLKTVQDPNVRVPNDLAAARHRPCCLSLVLC